ncbi:gonadotropin-releasing hormone II receptor-like protein, partial [Dinothrombium tinctorium]
SIIFRLQTHPKFKEFEQCVDFGSLEAWQQRVYNVFHLIILYFLPLAFIILCYSCICFKIYKRNTEKKSKEVKSTSFCESQTSTSHKVRRHQLIQQKILKETILIIIAFLICWTPYVTMTLWYQIDRSSAKKVEYNFQNVLFMFAVSNSCVNPFIYGKFYRC